MFRHNVVAFIFNDKEQFLACQRKDKKGWQFVQGGVEDTDTDVVIAALREIDEEIGLNSNEHPIEFVAHLPPPNGDPTKLRYLLPKYASPRLRQLGFIGQQQQVLLFFAPCSVIDHVRLIPTPEQVAAGAKQEFRSVQWMTFDEFLPRATDTKMHIFEYIRTASAPIVSAFLDSRNSSLPTASKTTTKAGPCPIDCES